MITIFLIDDQSTTRAILRLRLELEDDFKVIGEGGNNAHTVAQVAALAPDIVILDVTMPLIETEIVILLGKLARMTTVVVLSLYDDPATLANALAAGARVVVSKHHADERLLSVLRTLATLLTTLPNLWLLISNRS